MEGNLKSKLALLLVSACWGASGQPIECDGDQYTCTGDDYYCDTTVFRCRKCINCADFKRNPSHDTTKECIKSVVDCGGCFEGLTEDVQGLQCVSAPVAPAYVWVAIALGGVLLFVIAVVIVVYVLRNTATFRIFASTTSLQPTCSSRPPASAPEPPPPYNTLYVPVRPESPPAPLPPHFADEEAASPFIKRPPPPTTARESAGNQEANVFNNPNYVRGPHLPGNHQPKRDSEPEYLHDESTTESTWRPADTDNTPGESTESGSSSSEAGAQASGSPLSAQLAAARGTTLVRPPCPEPTPSKVPRLRQDTNNNRNNRDRDNEEPLPRASSAGAGATFNILVNVQQLNDVKL